jgi:hypothetical protein
MKRLVLLLCAGLAAAGPARAAGGMVCRTAGPNPIEAWFVISHTVIPAVVSARLTDDRRDVEVAVAQAWLDSVDFRADLTDRNATRHELRVRASANGHVYDGSLWRDGKRRWVRCRES